MVIDLPCLIKHKLFEVAVADYSELISVRFSLKQVANKQL